MRQMNDKMQQKNNEVRVKDFSESSIKTPTETDSDRQDKMTLSRNKQKPSLQVLSIDQSLEEI